MRPIRSFALIIFTVTFLSSGCVKKVTVAEVLPVYQEMTTSQLVSRINNYADVETFSANGYLYVRNYFTGKENKAEEYPYANQLIRLKRPENIRLQVNAPVVSSKVADMTSNGQSFRLAIFYPKDKRRFIYGSNLSEFQHMAANEIKENKDPRLAQAGGLLNMRPQHIVDAFLMKPATFHDDMGYFREEVRQLEPDPRPGKKNRMVERSYYVIYVIEYGTGRAELRRKFWFDRNDQSIPLVRQQTFENGSGRLGSDISYFNWFKVPDTDRIWPARVIVDRRNDGYRIELDIEPNSVEINEDLPDNIFDLPNKENLEEINLDAPKANTSPDTKKKVPPPSH